MDNNYVDGKVKWFASGGQSYGYIFYEDNGQKREIYVHYKNIKPVNQRDPKYREVRKNDVVRFKIGEGFRNTGTQALEVEILEYAPD